VVEKWDYTGLCFGSKRDMEKEKGISNTIMFRLMQMGNQ